MSVNFGDFETEHLGLGSSLPWQFAWTRMEKGKIVDSKEFYIDVPNLNVSIDAARVTGFNIYKYNDLKVPAETVVEFIEDQIVNSKDAFAGHNILGFDLYIMRNLYEVVGRDFDFKRIIYRCIDTLSLGRGRFHQIEVPDNKHERLAYMYKMLARPNKAFKGSLSAIAKDFGIEFDESRLHDALYDIKLNAQVYKQLIYGTSLPF